MLFRTLDVVGTKLLISLAKVRRYRLNICSMRHTFLILWWERYSYGKKAVLLTVNPNAENP